ncbi:MAG TPA: THUMP domain-containing protein [Candidatus Dormibacteraeota bacterium]|jgi:thiamine biosynthesis protein ThiI|nr:THUMP domain-containing protein [Candidatus Dormibacteraeota bacterium]
MADEYLATAGPSAGTAESRRRVLIRLGGELGTKSTRTRRKFLTVLVANAARALRAAGLHARVRQEWSRIWVDGDDVAGIREVVASLFGVHSATEVVELRLTSLDRLVGDLAALYRAQVRGRTFGVRARRLGRSDVSPQELAVALGAALHPGSAGVDLDAPQVEVAVMVGADRAWAALDRTDGPGGLPLGTGGVALALFSGGFDSPVAAWHVMRRGVEMEMVHFELGGGQVDESLAVASALCRRWAPGVHTRVHVVDLGPVVAALVQRCDRRLRQVLLKRAMYRAASALAEELGLEAMVTGEALAQVSTQTLRSLVVCEQAGRLPVLRPLIGMDKIEIIALARRIGTHQASVTVQETCSIADGKVITWPRIEAVLETEELVGEEVTEAWTRRQLEGRRVVDLAEWEPPLDLGAPAPEVEAVPEGALIVDVREAYEGEPVGDLRLPYSVALERLEDLDADREYVLVCNNGLRSGALAGRLRERGLRTWSLRGGLAALPAPVTRAAAAVPTA